MANIKIDEETYFYFLNVVYERIQKDEKNNDLFILGYIEKEHKLRSLQFQRRSYFDLYKRNEKENPALANMAYRNYIQIKNQIDEMRDITE